MKMMISLVCFLLASASQAFVLSWQVNLSEGNGSYSYARLFAVDNSTPNGGTALGSYIANQDAAGTAVTWTDIGGNSSYFYAALYNEAGTKISWSGTQSYSDLLAAGMIGSASAPELPPSATWVITGVVPEPTSVLLLGLGLSAVMLRRRVKMC